MTRSRSREYEVGAGSGVNVGSANIGVMELSRVLGEIPSPQALEIRPNTVISVTNSEYRTDIPLSCRLACLLGDFNLEVPELRRTGEHYPSNR